MLLPEQMQIDTTDRQLLYDLLAEAKKTNKLLAQLCPIAKDIVVKEVKPIKRGSKLVSSK